MSDVYDVGGWEGGWVDGLEVVVKMMECKSYGLY